MTLVIIFIIILGVLCIIFNPYIDFFKDYQDKYHMILWYNYNKKRKYINIIGHQ